MAQTTDRAPRADSRDTAEMLNVPEQQGHFVRDRQFEHTDTEYVWGYLANRTSEDGDNPACGVQVKQANGGWHIHVLRWAFSAETLTPLCSLPQTFEARRLAVAVAKDMMDRATAADNATDALSAYQRGVTEGNA